MVRSEATLVDKNGMKRFIQQPQSGERSRKSSEPAIQQRPRPAATVAGDPQVRLQRATNLGHRSFGHRSVGPRRAPSLQREELSESPQDSALSLAVNAVDALSEQTAASRLEAGRVGGGVVRGLTPHQPAIEEGAKQLSSQTRQQLVFLYGCIWAEGGSFWADRTFQKQGDKAAYDMAYRMPFVLESFDQLRLALAKAEAEEPLLEFIKEDKKAIPFLPLSYQELLAGYLYRTKSEEAQGALQELTSGDKGAGLTEETARDKARVDSLLHKLHAAVRAHGISVDAGRLVIAGLAAPEIFRAASPTQRVEFVAAAQLTGDQQMVNVIVALAPEDEQAELETFAHGARYFHDDVNGWVIPNIRKYGIETAYSNVKGLRDKWYWKPQRGIPRYASVEDRRELIYAIQESIQRVGTPTSHETQKQEAIDGLRKVRDELVEDASTRDADELRAAVSNAVVKTPLPKHSFSEIFMAELAGSVGLSPELGRTVGSTADTVSEAVSSATESVVGFVRDLPTYLQQVKDAAAEKVAFFKQALQLIWDNPEEYLGGAAKDLVKTLMQPSTLAQIGLFMGIMLVSNAVLPGAGTGLAAFLLKVLFGAVGILPLLKGLFNDLVGLVGCKDPKEAAVKFSRLAVRGLVGLLVILGVKGLSKLKLKIGRGKMSTSGLSDAIDQSKELAQLGEAPGKINEIWDKVGSARGDFASLATGGVIALGQKVGKDGYDVLPGLDNLHMRLADQDSESQDSTSVSPDSAKEDVSKKDTQKKGGWKRFMALLERLGSTGVGLLVRVKNLVVVGIKILNWSLGGIARSIKKAKSFASKGLSKISGLLQKMANFATTVRGLIRGTIDKAIGALSSWLSQAILAMAGRLGQSASLLLSTTGTSWIDEKVAALAAPVTSALENKAAEGLQSLEESLGPAKKALLGRIENALGHSAFGNPGGSVSAAALLQQVPIGSTLWDYFTKTRFFSQESIGEILSDFNELGLLNQAASEDALPDIFTEEEWIAVHAEKQEKKKSREALNNLVASGAVRWVGKDQYAGPWSNVDGNLIRGSFEVFHQATLAELARANESPVKTQKRKKGYQLKSVGNFKDGLFKIAYQTFKDQPTIRLEWQEVLKQEDIRRYGGAIDFVHICKALTRIRTGPGSLLFKEKIHQPVPRQDYYEKGPKGEDVEFSAAYKDGAYDIALEDHNLIVSLRIHLVPGSPDVKITDELKQFYQDGILDHWNYAYALVNGTSGTLTPILFDVQFTNDDPHHTVEIHESTDPKNVPPDTERDRENVTKWYTKSTEQTAAHEAGHMLGLKDEYAREADAYDRDVGLDDTPKIETIKGKMIKSAKEGLMGLGIQIKERYMTNFLAWMNERRLPGEKEYSLKEQTPEATIAEDDSGSDGSKFKFIEPDFSDIPEQGW